MSHFTARTSDDIQIIDQLLNRLKDSWKNVDVIFFTTTATNTSSTGVTHSIIIKTSN